ncbi:bactofilin family protein [Tistlia consotensis]|uniref:bactofilin family protein n=1 Tax=Tistlia consotensis TaxID=1321365 RepID=UPI001C52DCC7|nr:polymer-forming cytoskeletal protein [Tistlia consotensis]
MKSSPTDGGPGGAGASSSAAPAKRQASGVPSIVSADLRIEGNLHSIGDVQIDGIVNGDIASKTLTIGEGAEVHGAIEAESLRICGTVEGEVTAKTVILTKTARVYGDVLHESLSVEAGALIHGFCKRLDAPQKRSLPSPALSNGVAEPGARPALTDVPSGAPASSPAE